MGLGSLAKGVLLSASYVTIKTNQLTDSFKATVKHPIMQIMFEAFGLCVIQGGIAMNNYFETYTSWIFIPHVAYIPFHTCKETYMGTSQIHTNTQEIETFIQKTQDVYSGVPKDQLNPNIAKIMNIDTQSIPQTGIIEYKNYVRIDAEYTQEPQSYIIDTQFIKVGFPNILKFLRSVLDAMPSQVPVYFYSERTGGISKPWEANRVIKASQGGQKGLPSSSSHVYILVDFNYSVDRNDNKIKYNIVLVSSIFDVYQLKEDTTSGDTAKTNQVNSLASKTGV